VFFSYLRNWVLSSRRKMVYVSHGTLKVRGTSEVIFHTVSIFNAVNMLYVYKLYIFSMVFVTDHVLFMLFLT